MRKTTRNSGLLVLAALIWGIAFVAQSVGGDAVGPYTFNCIRSLIGSAFLLPVIALMDRLGLSRKPATPEQKKTLRIGGVCCGVVLGLASNLQQLGIYLGSSAGKAGFLTACYILLVPILGLFFHRKAGWNVWCGVVLTLAGLYLLCMNGQFSLQLSDILLLLCALTFSVHILVIDRFSPLVDGVRMSCIQFLVAGLLSAVPMLLWDLPQAGMSSWISALLVPSAWIPILYAGVLSCGVAYTLQIIGQQGVNPTVASLLMSLESVFSVIAGWILLEEKMGAKELCGCALIFGAVVLAQLPAGKRTG
jgi:drug/metabolite transporter (DMT)-like permease